MKKKHIIALFIVAILLIAGGILAFNPQLKTKIIGKPKIVRGYLCSDVCSEDDIKDYYEGIDDAEQCKKIGGEPYAYYGWGEYHACLAK